jgi:hypothetical protein
MSSSGSTPVSSPQQLAWQTYEKASAGCTRPAAVKEIQHVITLGIRILKLAGAMGDLNNCAKFSSEKYPIMVDRLIAREGQFGTEGFSRFMSEIVDPQTGGEVFTKGALMQATKPAYGKPFNPVKGNQLWDNSGYCLAAFKKFSAVWDQLLVGGKVPSGTQYKDHLEKVRLHFKNQGEGDLNSEEEGGVDLLWFPKYWWAFVLYGQYGLAQLDTESHLLMEESEEQDRNKGLGRDNRRVHPNADEEVSPHLKVKASGKSGSSDFVAMLREN